MSSNYIIADFDLLIDIDLGLLKLIKTNYNNGTFIDDLFLKMRDRVLINELLNRKTINPLDIAVKKEWCTSKDTLYKEFMAQEWSGILDLSSPTDILELLSIYIESGSTKVDIVCKNKQEEQIINRYNKKFGIVRTSDYTGIDITDYDSIFIKDYTKCLEFKGLTSKNIFVGRYGFNLEDDNISPITDISVIVGNTNIVNLIDVYNKKSYITIEG